MPSSRLTILTLIPLLAALLGAAPAQAAADECKLSCKGGDCSVSPARVTPTPGQWRTASPCADLKVTAGDVELRYLHKNRWFSPPPLRKGQEVRPVMQQFPPDACALLRPACLQASLDAKVGVVGGHGIDPRKGQPGGTGAPCEKALPCGAVLPPAGDWPLRLVDPKARGTLTVKLGRGQPDAGVAPQVVIDIQDGRGLLAAGWLQPGRLYVYEYQGAAGGSSASGEFLVMSDSRAQGFARRAAAREAQGLGPAQARYDTLMENELFWDALQMDLEATP